MFEPKIGTVVKSVEDYSVVVWEGDDKQGEYAVYNHTFGVVEASTPLLPQALEYLEQLQSGYDVRMKDADDLEDSGGNVHQLKPKDPVH